MIIFLISLFMFGMPMVMLDMNRPDPDAIDEIPENISSALAAANPNIDEELGEAIADVIDNVAPKTFFVDGDFFGQWLLDALNNQYLLALGEF